MNLPAHSTIQSIRIKPRWLEIDWRDGHRSQFYYIWLFDNCQDHSSLAPGTTQKLVDILRCPERPHPEHVHVSAEGELTIHWAEPVGRVNTYSINWLRQHDDSTRQSTRHLDRRLWDRTKQHELRFFDYHDMNDQHVKLGWIACLINDGFSLLQGCPVVPGTIEELAGRLGYIRETNYGRWFDVKPASDAKNLAYSSQGLSVHTDNPYRHPVPGIQLLHCLVADELGGQTTLVDGFRVAEELRAMDYDGFRLLARIPRQFRYSDDVSHFEWQTPIVRLDEHGEVSGIRFNIRAESVFSAPADLIEPYYHAYRKFVELLNDERFRLQIKLKPGDLLAVDNERVLHGRTGFDEGYSQRHLQGAYIDRDELQSRYRVLLAKLKGHDRD